MKVKKGQKPAELPIRKPDEFCTTTVLQSAKHGMSTRLFLRLIDSVLYFSARRRWR